MWCNLAGRSLGVCDPIINLLPTWTLSLFKQCQLTSHFAPVIITLAISGCHLIKKTRVVPIPMPVVEMPLPQPNMLDHASGTIRVYSRSCHLHAPDCMYSTKFMFMHASWQFLFFSPMFVGNCAHYQKGGWWYNSCAHSNLNGVWYRGGHYRSRYQDGVYWAEFRGGAYSLKKVVMMIRPNPNTFH